MDHYQALFEPDQKAGGYVVTFPDFGYGVTQGETGEEAMELARDLLMLTIGDYIREGKRLPKPSRRRGAPVNGAAIGQGGSVLGVPRFAADQGGVCPAYRNSTNAH
jgi:predicted RNase H-like HicB family nuclease